MAFRFSVLASGSSGNASWVQVGGFGLLIDVGLRPRELARRLDAVGASWRQVHAVLLTHTHSDHWNDHTLRHLHRLRIPLYCHAGHHNTLQGQGRPFPTLQADGLVREFEERRELVLAPGLTSVPIAVSHDSGPTFGFRLHGPTDLFGRRPALAYLSDLGCWDAALAQALADVDVLAVEFNHDVDLQRGSGRHPRLIARVLGDRGHLSNDQAAALVREVMRLSPSGRLRHVVQLHLSQQCNRPRLAIRAALTALTDFPTVPRIYAAYQDRPGPSLLIGESQPARKPRGRTAPTSLPPHRYYRKINPQQQCLPGIELDKGAG